LIGAVSWCGYNYEAAETLVPLPPMETMSIDPVVENANEMVELDLKDFTPAEDLALQSLLSVGCSVNIDRLNNK